MRYMSIEGEWCCGHAREEVKVCCKLIKRRPCKRDVSRRWILWELALMLKVHAADPSNYVGLYIFIFSIHSHLVIQGTSKCDIESA